MLYTFSRADYAPAELAAWLNQDRRQHAFVLWQDGVLLPLKYPQLFANSDNIFLLAPDVEARALQNFLKNHPLAQISLAQLVTLTEEYFPQVGL